MAFDRSKGRGQERDHAHRHETDFRATARRNKRLGLWTAELMNLSGDAAEAYAKEVVSADLAEPGDEDVLRKVLADFEKHGVAVSRDQVRWKMEPSSPRPVGKFTILDQQLCAGVKAFEARRRSRAGLQPRAPDRGGAVR